MKGGGGALPEVGQLVKIVGLSSDKEYKNIEFMAALENLMGKVREVNIAADEEYRDMVAVEFDDEQTHRIPANYMTALSVADANAKAKWWCKVADGEEAPVAERGEAAKVKKEAKKRWRWGWTGK